MLQPNCAAQGLAEQKTVNADGCEVITCIEGCTSDTDCNKDQRIEPKKCMRYQNFPGQCQPENIACAQVVTTACNPATACPQGAQCLRAQECVDFPNPCVVPPGWTTDTRPKPTPTEIPKPDKITANSITIDNETVIPDGNKQYTITMIGSDPSGGEYVGNEYVFTNIIDQNAQNYRGYIGWSNQNFPYWGNAFKTGYPISCTGGGFGAVFGGGYGAEYIKLISCTTKVSGYGRVTSFVVSYLPNFLSPAINYLDGFVAKAGDQSAYDGWKRFAKFSIDRSTINTPPTKITVLDTTIDKNSISANGSSQYTISVIAGAPGGGDTILDQQAFINLYSTYPNQDPTLYRGSFGWSLDNFPFNPADPYRKDHDEMDCKGGGKGVLFTGPNNMTFGKEYLKLLSCETTINTYNRKTDFHVVFNRNFSSPSANILWGFSATSTTVYDGWRPFNTFTLGLPDTNTPLSFTISLPGISTATAPQHLQRGVTVQMFNASNNNVGNKSGLVSFDNTNGTFQGSVDLGTDLPTGQYLVKVQMDNYLIKAIKNITTITIGAPTVIAPVTLTTGDLNMDNKIDILDYNIFVTCYGNKANSAVCQKPLDATTTKPIIFADINDDGVVDGTDYILFLKSLSVREGD
jgi:hypothetical protein